MSVHTQLVAADGVPVSLHWGMWHVQVLAEAMATEICARLPWVDPDDVAWFPADGFTFSDPHCFVDLSDGEVFPIHPGMRYDAWR